MKAIKYICIGFVWFACSANVHAQAKKPKLMIVPDDAWCERNGYMNLFDEQGVDVSVPDYAKAALNADFKRMTNTINQIMQDRGQPVEVDLEEQLKKVRSQAADDAALQSKSGAGMQENALDRLNQTAKADVWLYINCEFASNGPSRRAIILLDAKDPYLGGTVASAGNPAGISSVSSDIPTLIEAALLNDMDNFINRLQVYYDDILENGRKVELRIRTWDSFNGDLESDYGGTELQEIIEDWVAENSVGSNYSVTDASETTLVFSPVRIPLFNDKNRAIDARNWASDLQKMLRSQYSIESKLTAKGLGKVQLTIGER